MIAGEEHRSPKNAAEEYRQRLSSLSALQASDRRRGRMLGIAKLIAAGLTLASAVLLLRQFSLGVITAGFIIVFIVLAIRHEKLLQAVQQRSRIIEFYERGLARLEDGWQSQGDLGERFLDPAHPYARDLDIFGPASLFQYLSTARTRAGEATLSAWLQRAAEPDEIVSRQTAIRQLATRTEFRERLFSASDTLRSAIDPDVLIQWGERGAIFSTTARRVVATSLGVLWVMSLVAWAMWGKYEWAVAMTVLNFAYAHTLARDSEKAAGIIEKATADLLLLAGALAIFEGESFPPGRLADLQMSLRANGATPSKTMRTLARIVNPLESRHSLLARPLDLVTFWSAQLIFAAERWQSRFGTSIRKWIDTVGELEALSSLATFAYEHPGYAFPEIESEGAHLTATALAHPLLPVATAVENDVTLGGADEIMILSGPNMAGKSTFIRAVGVNAVLAQCGAPVRARSLRMSPLRVAASICILDSLNGGVSRFYAEIHRVKLIVDLAETGAPVLFLLDELLSGTNSHDRLQGTAYVLKTLAERHAIGIVSTHDLALTRIASELPDRVRNAHFEDRVDGEELIFDYKLKPGVVQTSNALHLMRAIGLGVKLSQN